MDNTAVLECLQQKKDLFAQYEDCTSQLNSCKIDAMNHYITQRGLLAKQIDRINREIDGYCDLAPDPDLMRDAVANHGDYGDFPRDLQIVYDKASEIFTHINHIYNMEAQIKKRMETERDELMKKVRAGRGTAKVYNYVKNLSQGTQNGVYLGNQKI